MNAIPASVSCSANVELKVDKLSPASQFVVASGFAAIALAIGYRIFKG